MPDLTRINTEIDCLNLPTIENKTNTIGNRWVKYSQDSDLVIVFVHGVLSNSEKCWKHEKGTFWPDLICSDDRIENASVFVTEYYTNTFSFDYGIADCAAELMSSLSLKEGGHDRSLLDFHNIVFVCHSLGGIVTRYLVESNFQFFKDRSIGFLLIASPSLGSVYADGLRIFTVFFKNLIGKQLRTNSGLLVDLDRRFKGLLETANGLMVGVEAIETDSYFGRKLTLLFAPIVSWESGSRYFGFPERIGGTNHSSIAKPTDLSHPSHRF